MSDTEVLDTVEDTPTDAAPTEAAPTEDAASDTSGTEQSPTSGQPRGADGKFLPKEATQPDAPTATEGEPAPAGEPSTAAAPESPSSEVVAEPVPFAIRALGTDYTFEHAAQNPDGSVTFKPEGIQHLQQLFGRALTLHRREGQILQQRAELTAHKAAADAELKVLAEEVWDKLKGVQTQDEFLEVAAEMFLAQKNIEERRQLARDRAMIATQQEPPPVSPDEVRDALDHDLEKELSASLQRMQAAPWAKGLTKDDWKRFADNAYRFRGQFVQIRDNAYYFDEDAAAAYVRDHAQWLLGERQKVSTTARQAQAADRKNEAAKITAVNAPPSVGTSTPASRPAAAKSQAVAVEAPRKLKTPEERSRGKRRFDYWREHGVEAPADY